MVQSMYGLRPLVHGMGADRAGRSAMRLMAALRCFRFGSASPLSARRRMRGPWSIVNDLWSMVVGRWSLVVGLIHVWPGLWSAV